MDKTAVERDIADMISKIMQKNITEDLFHENLFSERIELSPYHLVKVFFDLQARYGITFQKKDILEERFTTVSQIADLVVKGMEA